MLIPKLRPRANYGKGVVVEGLEFSWAAGGDKPAVVFAAKMVSVYHLNPQQMNAQRMNPQ